ncbi:uncharacterized protein LOC125425494 [Sphaerodactylus townsendi]|uniref:uncharacterized protein LOC125425494 n=1 Tax=Sphaerodactylus townsendi TaxID=933632 RepID=UPI002026D4A7|nr:uncharacterized protein LOC125425494 [Sphaerodactylus townsendi]
MAKYQAILIDSPGVKCAVSTRLNPATLLPDESPLLHDCIETIDMTYAARADLQDQPLENPEVEFWTDGSSYMVEGKRFSGFAVVTQNSVIEARTLPPTYSAQAAELMAVMRALVLATGQRANIYTDSRYAFGVAHAFGELWKQRGLLTSKGSKIKHASLVLGLLEAIDGPSELAIVHCKGHAAGDSILARGNRRADTAAKAAAGGKQVYYTTKEAVAKALIERLQRPRKTFWEEMEERDEEYLERAAWAQEVWEHEHAAITGALIPAVQDLDPIYTQKENKFAEGNGLHSREDGWWETEQGKIFVPEGLVFQILKNLHTGTHIGCQGLINWFNLYFIGAKVRAQAEAITKNCVICQRTNVSSNRPVVCGKVFRGQHPGSSWQCDFTELPRAAGYRYLLVFVDTMSGWPLAYPCRTCQAKEVVKVLLKDIVPAYGFPWEGIGSDNGAAFMAQVVQEVSRILRIPWKLHSSWRPQSSGMVERMNRSVKVSLTKIMQETSLKWPDALPLALLRVRTSPRGKWKLSPFEIMYGRPYPLSRPILADEARVGDALTVEYISCLAASVSQLHRDLNEIRPEGLTAPLHPFVPGDWVYIKGYKKEPLIPVWKGPFQVLLATQASVKVGGVKTWVHHTRLKHADAPPLVEARETAARDEDIWSAELGSDLRMLFRRKPAHCETPPPAPEAEEDETDAALTLPENEHI